MGAPESQGSHLNIGKETRSGDRAWPSCWKADESFGVDFWRGCVSNCFPIPGTGEVDVAPEEDGDGPA